MPDRLPSRAFRFGGFVLDVSAYELREQGRSIKVIQPLGVILLTCVVAYVIPRTSILGAVLLTGYMGGAIATHVRVSSLLLTHELFPVYVAAMFWGGLFLRDERLRMMLRRPL